MKRGVLLLFLFGCGDDTQPIATPNLIRMDITPSTFIVAVGKSKRVISEEVADNGARFDVSGTATWASMNSSIVKADSGGNITGVAAGMATVTASRDGLTGMAQVQVVAHDITSIAVTPGHLTIAKGGTGQLTATATLMDMSTVDITQTATWTSTNNAAVTVSKGTLTGVDFGLATINAASEAIMSNGAAIQVGDVPDGGVDAPVDGPELDAATD